ncbi:TRAP transporter substrate-binding protein [Starkeya sp. 3C]|uniref:TRAP transporter substrate-binding protein n=1 Tax=Ancylobacter moscoviensis TaxID=2597768 RepID=A0ABY3DLV7_9HYPH|nr:TRAP transporter substrate-binding protein [Ancylobacter moscoviensis]TSJ60151.1 TRAP transporter substrate-binding protein [Ancylobacter moscoviensis]
MKKLVLAALAAASIIAVSSPALAQKARLGHVFAQGNAADEASQIFARLVKERTNGEIDITVFPNSQIGGDEALGRDLSRGSVEFAFLNIGSLTGLDPLLDIHYLPYIATNTQEVDKIFYNPKGILQRTLGETLAKHNMVALAYFELDFRAVTNSKHPVRTVEDLKDLKVRVPGSASIRSFFEAAGSQAVTMPMPNLFVALQQGTVDGQDNGASIVFNSRLFEAQKYMTLTNHVYAMGAITVSKRFWDRLSEEQRKIVKQAAEEAAQEGIARNRAANAAFLEKIKAGGVEVVTPTPEAMAEFARIGQVGWQKLEAVYGAERIAELKKEIAAARGE